MRFTTIFSTRFISAKQRAKWICLHVCADAWDKKPLEVYDILQSNDCIGGFLVSNYEILHTQRTTYMKWLWSQNPMVRATSVIVPVFWIKCCALRMRFCIWN